jgi:hypothetical protein
MLEQLDVPALREAGSSHIYPRTLEYFHGESNTDGPKHFIDQVAEAPSLLSPGRVCVLYGYGSRPTNTYRWIQDLEGIDLIWHDDFGPWYLKPLQFVAASHGGLMRVTERSALIETFGELAHLAMVELYSFRKSLLPGVIDYVRQMKWRSFIGTRIGAEDESYFCFGVDGDSTNTDLQYFCWASYGEECPDDLRQLVRGAMH